MYKTFKRLTDLILATLALPFVLVVIATFSLFIKIEDKGPIIYKSKRVGKNEKIFNMYKLRTMYVNAPDIRLDDGSTFNSDIDTRVTKIGRFLRITSIDELPQIFNILKGDMSVVGPRPSTPYWLTICEEEDKEILKIAPGLTGYNQAYYRNSINDLEKYKNDLFYVRNMSFIFDLKIFFKTIFIVLKSKNVNRDIVDNESNDHKKTSIM